MPQDQDDIKGADAMKQAPTPGPLPSIPTVDLTDDMLFKIETGETVTWGEIKRRLAPTAPVEASGSELHPKTADLVDRFAAELKSKLAKAEAKYGYAADWLKPDWQDELTESLAEHIQKGDPRDVAAYCAFAWHHGWSTSDASEHFAPNFHFQTNRDQIAKCIRRAVGDAWIGDAQAEVAAEAVLSLRPQPSGETREGSEDRWRDRALSAEASMEAIRRIEDAKAFGALSATDVACYRYPGEDQQALRGAFVDGVMSQSAWSVWLRGPDEVVAAKSYADAVEYCDRLNAEAPLVRAVPMPVGVTLRPAPVASGGQHSSATDFPPDDVLACVPVAETAGEAVAWIDATDIDHLLEGNPLTTTLFPYETRDATKPLYAAPAPAQDDDKLRIAVEALEETKNRVREWPIDDQETCMCGSPVASHGMGDGHSPVSQGDHAISMIVEAINEALAALKSTAAQEGGA